MPKITRDLHKLTKGLQPPTGAELDAWHLTWEAENAVLIPKATPAHFTEAMRALDPQAVEGEDFEVLTRADVTRLVWRGEGKGPAKKDILDAVAAVQGLEVQGIPLEQVEPAERVSLLNKLEEALAQQDALEKRLAALEKGGIRT